jgi:glyoxylase-like metal-dependent hydrolase (beta-lactamase superfamily II)
MSTWRFGDVRVDRVLEFEKPLLAPQVLYPASTPADIDRHRHWLEPRLLDPETGLLVLAFHSFVIRTKRHVIVVDTCGGNDKPRPGKTRYHMSSWPYLERLAAAGVRPEEVTHVLCTHLHVDHVGWNTRLLDGSWVPTFPNAKYLFARAEWDYWREHYKTEAFRDDPYYIDSILPVIEAGQSVLVESDYQFEDTIWLDPTPGHTPGHVCVHIKSRGGEAVMSGDLMHHAVQCAEPQWSSCFCVDAEGARRTRRAFLERYAGTPTLIMPAHFPTPSVGRIAPAGNAFRFDFV